MFDAGARELEESESHEASKKGRRRRRKVHRAKDAADQSLPTENTSFADRDKMDSKRRHNNTEEEEAKQCSVCGLIFTSRTKLFQHIRSSGHAILRT